MDGGWTCTAKNIFQASSQGSQVVNLPPPGGMMLHATSALSLSRPPNMRYLGGGVHEMKGEPTTGLGSLLELYLKDLRCPMATVVGTAAMPAGRGPR